MRWFKHVTDASDDEFINALEEQFGLEGYARWWKLLEAIGKQMKPGCRNSSATYPVSKWMQLLSIKQQKHFKLFTNFLETSGKVFVNFSETFCEIEVPKLLEMADEYSKKSGQRQDIYPDEIRSKKEKEKKKEKESNKLDSNNDLENEKPIPENTELFKNTKSESPRLPEWLPIESWEAFIEMRKKIKKPPTEKAKSLLIASLARLRDEGHDPQSIIDTAIMNGWQAFYPPKPQHSSQKPSTKNGVNHEQSITHRAAHAAALGAIYAIENQFQGGSATHSPSPQQMLLGPEKLR